MPKHSPSSIVRVFSIIATVAVVLSFGTALLPAGSSLVARASADAAATCSTAAVPETYGKATQTINVSTAGNYRVWSRLKASSATDNSYYLQIDDSCTYTVGDSTQIPTTGWTWVNYQNADTASAVDVTLSAGTHTLTYIGREAGVQLDKVLALVDKTCVPVDLGDNCQVVDTTAPVVSITAPADASTVHGTVAVNATVYDLSDINKVEFYVDGTLKSTVAASAAYSYQWDSTTVANGNHSLKVKAYDSAVPSNVGESSVTTVKVNNPPAVGILDMDSSLIVDKSTLIQGQTISATAIYKNNSEFPVKVNDIRLVARTPAGDGTVDSGFFTPDTSGPYTVAPDETVSVSGKRVTSSADPVGTYWAHAEYIDVAGATHADATETSFTIAAPDTTAPTVSLTAPDANASVQQTIAIGVTADASDNIAVTKVEIHVDGSLKKTLTTAPYIYAWDTTGVSLGAHTISAKAYDAAGNVGTSPNVTNTVTEAPGTGLLGAYYNNATFLGTPVRRTDPTVDFNWAAGSPATGIKVDQFTARWTGYVVAPKTDTYTFATTSDDGTRLWVNDVQVVSNWGDHGAATKTGTIALVAGQKYPIKLEYYENQGAASAKLMWSTVTQPQQVVPATQLYPAAAVLPPPVDPPTPPAGPDSGTGLTGQYYSNTGFTGDPIIRLDSTVNFDWGTGAPIGGIGPDKFSVRWTGYIVAPTTDTYTFATTSDDGTRLSVNGVSLVNNWGDHGAVTKSGKINLEAGKKYAVTMEYYENQGAAVAKLFWSSSTQAQQAIPQAQLYPAGNVTPPVDPPTPPAEPGTGLTGQYYGNATFLGSATTILDSNINFNWGSGAPLSGMQPDHFSIRWTGYIVAPKSDTYTFATTSDDGTRLTVDNILLVNNWGDHSAVTKTGTINLVAGQKYPIKLEYYENQGAASAKLMWNTSTLAQQIVPTSQLYL